ncbi:MAG: DUF3047 domain-containing protein [Gammaproteobacteria bacterium]|nr:DUF3047 domain-containing protein [Gammaproteobacteria bacterium]
MAVFTVGIVISFSAGANGNRITLTAFKTTGLEGWEEKSFQNQTRYQLIKEADDLVLNAVAEASASVLYNERELSLLDTPILNWSWRVEQTYGKINEQSKQGDDYPARVYVVAKTGPFPWNTLALNYVWSSNSEKGQHWPNAYTEKAHMIVLRTGDGEAKQWLVEKRNIRQDFKTYFDKDIETIHGVAIMTDSDNTGKTGEAFYKDLYFTEEVPATR